MATMSFFYECVSDLVKIEVGGWCSNEGFNYYVIYLFYLLCFHANLL